jgi:TetR/AcrR family transcriptional regulator, fatty acid metabolism regulator protein
MASRPDTAAARPDKRRMILDAAVIAFAKRGFHACRVSDIADEANVAYGLVYHYFRSKDEVLDTLFLERWDMLLAFISETGRQAVPPREKLHAIAAAIIDFYRYDPALMKVIIVEVMRSANSFGMRHSDKIAEAYVLIGDIVSKAQDEGTFKREVSPRFAALAFYGAIEQVLTGWIFGMLPEGEAEYEQAKASIVETICGGLDAVGGRAAADRYV